MQSPHKIGIAYLLLHRTCNPHHLRTPYYIACLACSCIITIVTGKEFEDESQFSEIAATFSAHDAPEAGTARLGQTLLDRIGNTPLLRFDSFNAHLPGVTLLGKAEWYNPGGSVKDRAAANIVAEGRRSGRLTPGKILLDATSGNTGIAYAMLGAAEKFPVTLCMPTNVSAERKKILQAYGAQHFLYRSR